MSDDAIEQRKLVKKKANQALNLRKKNYSFIFDSDQGNTVLKDLAKFCRAHESTYNKDPRLSDILEGRREVWLRIQNHLQLTDDQLWELYK